MAPRRDSSKTSRSDERPNPRTDPEGYREWRVAKTFQEVEEEEAATKTQKSP